MLFVASEGEAFARHPGEHEVAFEESPYKHNRFGSNACGSLQWSSANSKSGFLAFFDCIHCGCTSRRTVMNAFT